MSTEKQAATIYEYLKIFNNNTINLNKCEIHTTEYDFMFRNLEQMILFMRNEISLYNANTNGALYIHETII